jgi:hypothetical protein
VLIKLLLLQIGISAPATSFSSHDIASLSLKSDDEDVAINCQLADTSVDWSITFEQFLASVLNESVLVNFFEQRVDVVAKLVTQLTFCYYNVWRIILKVNFRKIFQKDPSDRSITVLLFIVDVDLYGYLF